eukprot:1241312-Pleurochrysis_carterae.AAC.2
MPQASSQRWQAKAASGRDCAAQTSRRRCAAGSRGRPAAPAAPTAVCSVAGCAVPRRKGRCMRARGTRSFWRRGTYRVRPL